MGEPAAGGERSPEINSSESVDAAITDAEVGHANELDVRCAVVVIMTPAVQFGQVVVTGTPRSAARPAVPGR